MAVLRSPLPGADDLMMRVYAAMAQKERELISERTRAALAAAKARGRILGGDRGYRPDTGPDAAAGAQARREAAERAAHRLALEMERLRAEGVEGHAEMARLLTVRGVPTPRGRGAWTHTTVSRVLSRLPPEQHAGTHVATDQRRQLALGECANTAGAGRLNRSQARDHKHVARGMCLGAAIAGEVMPADGKRAS